MSRNLRGLLEIKGYRHAFDLKFLELILNIVEAADYFNTRCVKMMTELIAQVYLTTYRVSLNIIKGRSTLREEYDKVLIRRAELLIETGFRLLSVKNAQERALLRMLLISRTASADQAELFLKTYDALSLLIRTCLLNDLNVDGYNDGKAILPYYMPAIFSEALENVTRELFPRKIEAVSSLIRFLIRVLDGIRFMPGKKSKVVKRNMFFTNVTIRSEEFKQDPTVLDKLKIPAVY